MKHEIFYYFRGPSWPDYGDFLNIANSDSAIIYKTKIMIKFLGIKQKGRKPLAYGLERSCMKFYARPSSLTLFLL